MISSVAHIFGDHLPHFSAQIFGQRRVRIGQRLILTDQAAQLDGERFQSRLSLRVRSERRGLVRRRKTWERAA